MNSLDEAISRLADAMPRTDVSSARILITAEEVADIPLTVLAQAVEVLIKTTDFFPTVRQIRETAAELVLALPTEDEALTLIEQALVGDGALNSHADVKRALKHVGGLYAFRNTDEPTILRSQFLKLYREIRKSHIRDLMLSFRPALSAA